MRFGDCFTAEAAHGIGGSEQPFVFVGFAEFFEIEVRFSWWRLDVPKRSCSECARCFHQPRYLSRCALRYLRLILHLIFSYEPSA